MGVNRGVKINADLTHQFLNISARARPDRIHLLDPGTLLIAYNSHQQCKSTVTATTTTTTREDDHKAQEAGGGGVCVYYYCCYYFVGL